MRRINVVVLVSVVVCLIPMAGCQDLVLDKEKLFRPGEVSEIVDFLAGLGTTFAAVPDPLAMLTRKSSEGTNPRMGAIMGAFQVLWVITDRSSAHGGDPVERHCRIDQLGHGRRLRLLPAPGKRSSTWSGKMVAGVRNPMTSGLVIAKP